MWKHWNTYTKNEANCVGHTISEFLAAFTHTLISKLIKNAQSLEYFNIFNFKLCFFSCANSAFVCQRKTCEIVVIWFE